MTPEGLTDSWLSSVLATEVRVRSSNRVGEELVGMNVRLSPESDDCCGGTHGEHRLDNLMFGGPEGASPVAGVDWQTPGNGLGITDVSYFLAAGLLPRDRRLIERDLVDEYALAGIVLSVIASQIVGSNDRSEAMFAAMATRDAQHALDPKSEALL